MMTHESQEQRLGPVSQIPPGEGRVFALAGREVAVFHTRGGALYATQAECPHRIGPLADGLTGGTTLMCPLHGWKFDLRTGEALQGECGIRTYPVRRTEDGEIAIDLAAVVSETQNLPPHGGQEIGVDQAPVLSAVGPAATE